MGSKDDGQLQRALVPPQERTVLAGLPDGRGLAEARDHTGVHTGSGPCAPGVGNGAGGGFFQFGWFAGHSGFQLPWKIDLDALDDRSLEGLADLLMWKFAFSEVVAVPSDETPPRKPAGPRLARILQARHLDVGYPTLILDDVLTLGTSMEECRRAYLALHPDKRVIGFVILARCPKGDGGVIAVPDWVWPLLSVNEWSQSRATGLG